MSVTIALIYRLTWDDASVQDYEVGSTTVDAMSDVIPAITSLTEDTTEHLDLFITEWVAGGYQDCPACVSGDHHHCLEAHFTHDGLPTSCSCWVNDHEDRR